MDIFNRKITIEVIFGKKKANVKMLVLSKLSETRIIKNFNEVITKNKIKYESVVSDNLTSADYAHIFKLIQDEMYERRLEIIIYSFEKVENKQNLFNVGKRIFLIIIITAFVLISVDQFKPELWGVARTISELI